jgi:hypothetical protein
VTNNLLFRAPPCFRRHVKPLVWLHLQSLAPTSALGRRGGLWPILFMCNVWGRSVSQEWDINRLMMLNDDTYLPLLNFNNSVTKFKYQTSNNGTFPLSGVFWVQFVLYSEFHIVFVILNIPKLKELLNFDLWIQYSKNHSYIFVEIIWITNSK